MNICIGGDLDGQSVAFDGNRFKASIMDIKLRSEYCLQVFTQENDRYLFWVETEMKNNEVLEKIIYFISLK